jgi:hypothetical protein
LDSSDGLVPPEERGEDEEILSLAIKISGDVKLTGRLQAWYDGKELLPMPLVVVIEAREKEMADDIEAYESEDTPVKVLLIPPEEIVAVAYGRGGGALVSGEAMM